ncbi:MAG: flagellar assembly peptidoglycan hydrolase FlgJ [Rhodocyclaceae bacterium]|nr:flagellar assembly peptidoglycan hydrolase FlgJ [Rhodocyclaceae bacterium]
MTSSAIPSIFDTNNLAALKGAVKKDDPKALKSAAQQFEALFLQMVLKSMRDATPREGMLDSDQTRMYESLFDQQLAQVMSAKGNIGLAALIEKQLKRDSADPVSFEDGLPLRPEAKPIPVRPGGQSFPLESAPAPLRSIDSVPYAPRSDATAPAVARDFIARVTPQAEEASRATGIPAPFLVAQAALETGWGRSEPRLADGRPSYNLFGIKAGRNWSGASVDAATTEYVDGVALRQNERFRAYGSYAEAFRDYADLLRNNPRYASVLGTQDASSFARGLQRAGYATDPLYADKLTRIIGGMIPRTSVSA